MDNTNKETKAQENVHTETEKCFHCGNTEEHVALLPCRKQGQNLWVCTRCLPVLIHG